MLFSSFAKMLKRFTFWTIGVVVVMIVAGLVSGCGQSREDELYDLVADGREHVDTFLLGEHWKLDEPYVLHSAYRLRGFADSIGIDGPQNFAVYAARVDVVGGPQDLILFWAELDLEADGVLDPVYGDAATRPYSEPGEPCVSGDLCDQFVVNAKQTLQGQAVLRAVVSRPHNTPWVQD